MKIFCTFCSSQLKHDDSTCPNCGAPTKSSFDGKYVFEDKGPKTRDSILREFLSLPEQNNNMNDVERYIKVFSLVPYILNISTLGYGQGKNYRFENVGSFKMIPYKELIEIIDSTRRFAEVGYYIIMDKGVVNIHNLGEDYNRILQEEEFVEL